LTADHPQRDLWDYYDRRVAQGVPGLANAVSYWTGLGVSCSEAQIAEEAAEVERTLRSLPAMTFLEVGAGPGTFTGMVPGSGVALDQSQAALRTLRSRLARVPVVGGDGLRLPFQACSFGRLFASHLYGLLPIEDRTALLNEARGVASELVVLDAGRPRGVPSEHWQERTLPDGSAWRVFRRHFDAEVLAGEIGGEVLFGGRFYVIVQQMIPAGGE
jgi:hypothetical protein